MNENDRQELYELFQKIGKSAVYIFAKDHNYSFDFVANELDEMIDAAYDMAM